MNYFIYNRHKYARRTVWNTCACDPELFETKRKLKLEWGL